MLDMQGDEHRVNAIFDRYDSDGNGVIDVDEFRCVVKDHLREIFFECVAGLLVNESLQAASAKVWV